MTKVAFYKLASNRQSAFELVCQLIKKACRTDQQVLCLLPDNRAAEQLDQMLWSFEAAAFVPHGLGAEQYPVAISADSNPADHHQILINLQQQIPSWFSRFDRVIEVIYQQPEYQQAKRENFRFYKERGYSLSFHDLSNQFPK